MFKYLSALLFIANVQANACNPQDCLTFDGAKNYVQNCGAAEQCYTLTIPKNDPEATVLASKQWNLASQSLDTMRSTFLKPEMGYEIRKQMLKMLTDEMSRILGVVENNLNFISDRKQADLLGSKLNSLKKFVAKTASLNLQTRFMENTSSSVNIFKNGAMPLFIESWTWYYKSVTAKKTSIRGRIDCFTGCSAKECGTDKLAYQACLDQCPPRTIKNCKTAGDKSFAPESQEPVVGEFDGFDTDAPQDLSLQQGQQ